MNFKKILITLAALSGFFIARPSFATCSNFTTYTDGTVLTAASLNSLQTNYTNCVNNVLNGDIFTGNVLLHSASDLNIYSDTGSTLKASIDGLTGQAVMGLRTPGKLINLNLANATTTNANDSIKIQCGGSACSASNPGFVTLASGATQGSITTFAVTADVTILLTGAHWGVGTKGDITDAIHRVYAVDLNGTLAWCVGYQGGFTYITNTQGSITPTDINLPEELLCNVVNITSSTSATEVGWYFASFDDTGGAAEDLWAVQTGVGDINTGKTADGIWQPWTITTTGFSANPTVSSKWTQVGKTVYLKYQVTSNGTSNSTLYRLTTPIKMVAANDFRDSTTAVTDNSVASADLGLLGPQSTTTLDIFKDNTGTAWTNANNKGTSFMIFYEAFQP